MVSGSARGIWRRLIVVLALVAGGAIASNMAAWADGVENLLPGTAVLLSSTTSTTSSGNGGTATTTSSMTNIFSPATPVDYKHSGGEPTVTVDRYPFNGPFTCTPAPGTTVDESACMAQSHCSLSATLANPCYRDLTYVSNPLGVGYPGYSEFYKSEDLGQTFRVPPHDPVFANPDGTAGAGGGDSYQVVGEITHSVFFVDLSGLCVSINVSRDLGETFQSDRLGCASNVGAIDDRQWVATDETYPDATGPMRVYVSFNNDTSPSPSITLARSKKDGSFGSFLTDSSCTPFTGSITVVNQPDSTPTACPDPGDPQLVVSGAIQVDKSPSSTHHHTLYIPFTRFDGANYLQYVAISTDGAESWTRHLVANVGPHNPANIFPDLTIDTAGNLYFDWSQDQSTTSTPGEQDVYYTFSQGGGLEGTWSTPTDITQETGDSAVFPWMVAGTPGQVDIVFYKANCGLNSNAATNCAWNVYWGNSNNLLTGSRNINSVQISDHPNHIGPICTLGTNCGTGTRNLLDFFTVDVDHEGAANVSWADDNNGRNDTRDRYSHQIQGNGVFGQPIDWHQSWPIKNHEVTDPAGDVYDAAGSPVACPGMDILDTSEQRGTDSVTVTLTLGGPPSALVATTCSNAGGTGGLWGAEWWSASTPDPTTGGGPNDNFYIALRDTAAEPLHVEAGRMNNLSLTLTSEEFHPTQGGTLGGTCFAAGATGPCTVVLTTTLSTLGIKSGAGLYGITGLTVYYYLTSQRPPFLRVPIGNSQQADASAPFDQEGTGQLP